MGQDEDYYFNLKNLFGAQYYSILLALRDVGIFPRISETFENSQVYRRSLMRENYVEELSRTIRFQLAGIDLKNCYRFNYKFTPPYSQEAISIRFDFENDSTIFNTGRIHAIIGRNGTGKTSLLAKLANDLSSSNSENITPHKPLFAKIFTVSYSFFDRFKIPEPNLSFNYVYCGLKKPNNTWLTEDELKQRFYERCKKYY